MCQHELNSKNLAQHLRHVHNLDPEWGEAIRYSTPVRIERTVVAAVPYSPPVLHAVPEPDPVVVPWEVDDIVMPVIEQLASPGHVVPVASLAALFAWRDATAEMLRQVSRADAR
jgi:hypothetical protein